MNRDELLAHVDRLLERLGPMLGKRGPKGNTPPADTGDRAGVEDLLQRFAGSESAFYQRRRELRICYYRNLISALSGFRSSVEAGLQEAVTPEREAQFGVVTDLLDLAQPPWTRPASIPVPPPYSLVPPSRSTCGSGWIASGSSWGHRNRASRRTRICFGERTC